MIRINLLPEDERRAGPGMSTRQITTGILVLVLVIAASSMYAMKKVEIHDLKLEIEALDRDLALLAPFSGPQADLDAKLSILRTQYNELRVLDTSGESLWSASADLVRILDEDAWLRSFEITSDNRVSLRGSAVSYSAIARTMENLGLDPRFEKSELVVAYLVSGEDEGSVGFEVRSTFVGGGI